jgi:NAD+ kinase
MIIALFFNEMKEHGASIATDIRKFLTARGVTVVTKEEAAKEIGALPLSSVDADKIDFIISLGGDGTILRILHRYPNIHAPLLGVNLGGLGFMADISNSDIHPSLEDLIDGSYNIQKRLKLEGEKVGGESHFAINDIVIHRARNPSLIDLAIHVDGHYLNTFSADGIIIATPGGSTAYSLAAGGPIVSPTIEAVVLTPICPHTISNRPIVLLPKQEIQIEYLSAYDPVEVTFDGISSFDISTGQILRIRPSKEKISFVMLSRHDYFSTLRSKLDWAGKLKRG